jgi:hypothetical protein
MRQSGAFTVLGGSFVTAAEEPVIMTDVVTPDDAIITGSICTGYDCLTDGTQTFGYENILLKKNDTQIKFEDTSTLAGYPSNDWAIIANDTFNGGANYLAFQDVTGTKTPFKVMAGAPTNSLFVSSTGNIGVGTSTPAADVHILSGDNPLLRLEQDASGGWPAQTWDVFGNETSFYIRDMTHGGTFPFRIQPGAPTNALTIRSNGRVGVGTFSPEYDLDVARTGAPAYIRVQRTDGASIRFAAGATFGTFGTENNFPLGFRVNAVQKIWALSMRLYSIPPRTRTPKRILPQLIRKLCWNACPLFQFPPGISLKTTIRQSTWARWLKTFMRHSASAWMTSISVQWMPMVWHLPPFRLFHLKTRHCAAKLTI